jgi:hypothetical protein
MSAKCCLLCGAPLGRIRVGAGEDFCSREHRNQYRLKRSMECLSEANKVATLARRRENPKPLSIGALPCLPGEPRAHTPIQSFNGAAVLTPNLGVAAPRFSAPMAGPVRLWKLKPRKTASRRPASAPISSSAAPARRNRVVKATRSLAASKAELIPLLAAAPSNTLRVSSGTAFRPRLPRASEAAIRMTRAPRAAGIRLTGAGKDFLPVSSVQSARRSSERLGVTEMRFTATAEQALRMEWVGVLTDQERAR